MRSPARFFDPLGTRYGLPTYPWGYAPDGLATRSQLAKRGLRPAGQEPVAQIAWASRRAGNVGGVRTALLYRIDAARPKRPLTPAKERALARAYLARCTCTACGRLWDVCLPTGNGRACPTGCANADDLALLAGAAA